jgi:hypothetical protein
VLFVDGAYTDTGKDKPAFHPSAELTDDYLEGTGQSATIPEIDPP